MNLDMKARKPASSRRTSGGGMLIGLFVGLVIGVLVAAGVVWYIHRTPMPFNNKVQPPPPPPAQAAAGQQPTPMPLPGKPGDPIPQQGDKPRFDFYKILPGNAEATPESKEALRQRIQEHNEAAKKLTEKVNTPGKRGEEENDRSTAPDTGWLPVFPPRYRFESLRQEGAIRPA